MKNKKGFTHWVVVILISVMTLGLVGVTWYYERNKEDTTSHTNKNTNNIATNTNVSTINATVNTSTNISITNANTVNITSGITSLRNEQDVRDYIKSVLTDSTNVFSECKGSSVNEGTTITALPNDWFRIRCSVPLKKGEMEIKIDKNSNVIDGPTYIIPDVSM